MDSGFYLALGVAVFTPALQYSVPAVPSSVAMSGIVAGGVVMLSEFLPSHMKPPLSAVVLFLLAALCLGGAVHLYLNHLRNESAPPKSEEPPILQGLGGKGGDAKVGGSGMALGGRGGQAGKYGSGGAGGSAEVSGDGVAAGGSGGAAGDEGVWRAPAKSGYEVYQRKMSLPVDPEMRKYGRGGAGAGYEPKLHFVEQLRAEYFRLNDLKPQSAFENIEAVPIAYINGAVASKGVNWRVRIVDDEYEFFLPGQ